jgi:hypothetical protein
MCDYCNNNTEETLIGSDGVCYDKNNDKYYLYIHHFQNEIYRIEVDYCSRCGLKLKNS